MHYIASGCSIDFIYQERLRIMLQVQEKTNFDSKTNTINCVCNVSRLFSILLNSTCDSIQRTMCSNCKDMHDETISIITPGWLNVITNGIFCLEEEIKLCLENRKVFCKKCNHTTAILSYQINNFIAVDLEDCYREDVIKTLKKNSDYQHVTLR